MALTRSAVGALLAADLAASVDLIRSRSQVRRFVIVVLGIAVMMGVATLSVVRGSFDDAAVPAGVASAIGVSSVVLGTVLMSIVGEFRSTTDATTSRWLSRQPISTVWSYLVPRSTTWLSIAVVTVVTVPALSWTIMESTGSGLALSVAVASLSVAIGSALGLLVATTPGQVGLSNRGAAAGSITFWIVFAAASGAAIRRIFDQGIDDGWTWWFDVLGWPALVRLTVDEVAGNFVSPIVSVVAVVLAFRWRVRSPNTGASDHVAHARHEWRFGSLPIVGLEAARVLRNPKLRNHGLALVVGTFALLGGNRLTRLDSSAAYSYAALFSLMTGSLLIAKRGTSGRTPLATRTLFDPKRYFVQVKLSDALLVLVLAVGSGLALTLVPSESDVFVFLARSIALCFGLATVIGSSYVVAARDSIGDLIAVGGLMAGFVAAGRMTEGHHLVVGLVSVGAATVAFGLIESTRYLIERT